MAGNSGGFELRGINHLALVCRDMERTVDFDSVGKKNLLLSATPLRRA